MPHTLVIEDHRFAMTVKHAGALVAETTEALKLIDECVKLRQSLGLTRVSFKVDSNKPGVWDYRVTLNDGRVWRQEIDFDGQAYDGDPFMTFNVVAKWKLSEFSLLRPLRDWLVETFSSRGVEEVLVVWK